MSKSPEGVDFTLSEELVDSLQYVGKKHGMNVLEALKHAIVMQKFLEDQEIAGNNLYINNPSANTITPINVGPNDFRLWESEL